MITIQMPGGASIKVTKSGKQYNDKSAVEYERMIQTAITVQTRFGCPVTFLSKTFSAASMSAVNFTSSVMVVSLPSP